jgi:predicted transcriptional regulator
MEPQETYTIQDLFDLLPLSIRELANISGINEVTLARIRDGKTTRRSTANKLMLKMSEIYGRTLTIRNVTGINVMRNYRTEKKEAKSEQKS